MKHHHLAGLKTRLAMAVRFRPQPVRKSQYTRLIGILFRTLGWKQIRYFPSYSYRMRFALPKERKSCVGLRIHWSNPCRFNSCRPHHIKSSRLGNGRSSSISVASHTTHRAVRQWAVQSYSRPNMVCCLFSFPLPCESSCVSYHLLQGYALAETQCRIIT